MAGFLSKWCHHALWISFTCFLFPAEGVVRNLDATGNNQYLTFPSSGNYDNNVDMQWRISASNSYQKVKITFVSMSIESHSQCTYDALSIYDGSNSNAPKLAKLCGQLSSLRQKSFNSSSQYLFLRFNSDNSNRYRGFKILYTIEATFCQGEIIRLTASANVQDLTFPSSGSSYPSNCRRYWRITSNHNLVKLYILDMDVESSVNCRFDALTIYDGYDSTSQQAAKNCGTFQNRTYTLNSSYLFLSFTSDGDDEGVGFRILYVGNFCQDEVAELSATAKVQYLTFPTLGNYPSNCQRQWRITSSHMRVKLYILNMDIETSASCRYDALTIYDGYNVNNRQLAKLCQRSISRNLTFTSTSAKLFLKFKSDGSRTGKGFRIAYTNDLGNPVPSSIAILTATVSDQYLTYPTWGNYFNDAVVEWKISTSISSQKLKIVILSLDIEYEVNCRYDALTIYDGSGSNAPELAKLCGQLSSLDQTIFRSTSQKLFLRFTSNRSVRRRGFKISYTSELYDPTPNPGTYCQNEVVALTATANAQHLIFPTNGSYLNNCQRHWRIVSRQRSVKLYILNMDVELTTGCHYDALTIYDGYDSNSPQIAKLCGTFQNRTYTSTSSYLFLRFTSDTNIDGAGFHIVYLGAFCQGEEARVTATAEVQYLTFPPYGYYPSNCQRQWQITSSHHRVNLFILKMDLGSLPAGRLDDAFTIYDGYNAPKQQLLKLGGRSRSYSRFFTSTSTKLFLRFKSDYYRVGKGFRIAYTNDLGNPMTTVVDLIATSEHQSLTFPRWGNYENNVIKQWRISSSNSSHQLKIVVVSLNIEHASNCRYDALTIYDGSNINAPKLATLCGQLSSLNQTLFRSNSNEVFLLFTSDQRNRYKGFKLRYTMSEDGTQSEAESSNKARLIGGIIGGLCALFIVCLVGYIVRKNNLKEQRLHPQQDPVGNRTSAVPTNQNARRGSQRSEVFMVTPPPDYSTVNRAFVHAGPPPSYTEATRYSVRPSAPPLSRNR